MSATAALIAPGISNVGRWFFFDVLVTPTGTYTTNGDTLDLSAIGVPGKAPPICYGIQSKNGHVYKYEQGTTSANGKFRVYVATTTSGNAPLNEHSNAAFNAGVTGDVITMCFKVQKYKAA